MRQFQQLFPNLPLTSLIKGYLAYTGHSKSKGEEQPDESESELSDDPVDLIVVGNRRSVLA
jgi:hypothetical protein